MRMNKVRPGRQYRFRPVGLDRWDPRHRGLADGEIVTVKNLPGAPPAGTMGHCHVVRQDGTFGGLVLVNSLEAVR